MLRVLTTTLCLTHNCTLRCKYCYAGRKYSHAMSKETARKAIDISIEEANRLGRALDLSFFGGEPLMEWELLQWCYEYLESRKAELPAPPRYGITTNGTLLTAEKLEWMAQRNFLIGISIDGSAAMHNANRCYANGQGSHEDVARAVKLLNEHPTIRTKAICVVTPNNVHLLEEGVQWIASHFNKEIGLNIDYWSEWSDEQFDILSEQYQRVAAMVLQSYRTGNPIQISNISNKISSHIHEKDSADTCAQCTIGEREIGVTVDGNFFPCSRLVGIGDEEQLNFGNVTEGINRARQHWIIANRGNTTPACKLCELRQRCVNSCGCTNHASTGHINQVSPFLCCSERLAIDTADNLAEILYAEKNPAFMQQFYPQSM